MELLNQNKILTIIWIDKNIYSPENIQYLRRLGYDISIHVDGNNFSNHSNYNLKYNAVENKYDIHPCQTINEAILLLKDLGSQSEDKSKNKKQIVPKFKPTIIIVSGSYFVDFTKEFNKNINDIYVIPKIIIFTSKIKNYNLPEEIKKHENFYCKNVKTDFNKIEKEIEKIQNKFLSFPVQNQTTPNSKNANLIFEQVTKKEDLVLPMFYRTYIEKSDTKGNYKFINKTLKEKNYISEPEYKDIFYQIEGVEDIPIELLSKYYARLYTIEGDFYKEMKRELTEGNEKNYEKYHAFIKTFFEASDKGALKSFSEAKLYSAQILTDEEINKLFNHKKNRKKIYLYQYYFQNLLFLSVKNNLRLNSFFQCIRKMRC